MRVSELKNDGLSRFYSITVPAVDFDQRLQQRFQALAATTRLPGFRPGKVPLPLLRRRFGDSVRAETLQEVVSRCCSDLLRNLGVKSALTPEVALLTDRAADSAIDSGATATDVTFSVSFECLPEIPELDFGALQLTRALTRIDEAAVEKEVLQLAALARGAAALPEGAVAEDGDLLTIDCRLETEDGTVVSEERTDTVRLGDDATPPELSEQLRGAAPGQTFACALVLPDRYPKPELRGATVTLRGVVKEARRPDPLDVNDAMAQRLGVESLQQLREKARAGLEDRVTVLSRADLKKQLFDALCARADFELPPSLVTQEFDQLWARHRGECDHEPLEPNDVDSQETADAEHRAEHRVLAERRVRLALLLTRIGERHAIKVSEEDIGRAFVAYLENAPPQTRSALIKQASDDPSLLSVFKGPALEAKVVDFILEMVQPSEEVLNVSDFEARIAGRSESVAGASPPAALAAPGEAERLADGSAPHG